MILNRNNHHSHNYTLEVKTLSFFAIWSDRHHMWDGCFFCMCVHLPFITGNLLMSASKGVSVILSLKQEFWFSFRFSIHKRYHKSLLYRVYTWKKTAASLITDYYYSIKSSMSVHYFCLNNYILIFSIKI